MRKANLITQILQERIAKGDHVLAGLPSERRLAEELGMSRTTVRAAVGSLVKQGVLERLANGRLAVNQRRPEHRVRRIGLLLPIGPSQDVEQWRQGVEEALGSHAAALRPVTFGHWGDAAVADALTGFDGLFVVSVSERMPTWLTAKMRESQCRVVVLDQDETDAGLPSVIMFRPESERKLFEHLVTLGHRRIDCINTQVESRVIEGRIAVWAGYIAQKSLEGELHSIPTANTMAGGHEAVGRLLAKGGVLGSALFCTTGPTAIGVMRALQEAGLEIGRDVSVCAVNDEGMGRYLLKSLTALESPPRAKYLRAAVDWLLGRRTWRGPLLVEPADVPLFVGESTGPAPRSSVVSRVGRPGRH